MLNYYSFVGTTHYKRYVVHHIKYVMTTVLLGDYDIIHGSFFVCGLTRDDFTDLTPKQMKHYEEMYHDPQLFFLLGKTLCVEHTTPEGYAQFMQATRQPPRQEQER